MSYNTLIHKMYIKLNDNLKVWGLSSHSRMFRSYGDVTITGEVKDCKFFTYVRHLKAQVSFSDQNLSVVRRRRWPRRHQTTQPQLWENTQIYNLSLKSPPPNIWVRTQTRNLSTYSTYLRYLCTYLKFVLKHLFDHLCIHLCFGVDFIMNLFFF